MKNKKNQRRAPFVGERVLRDLEKEASQVTARCPNCGDFLGRELEDEDWKGFRYCLNGCKFGNLIP